MSAEYRELWARADRAATQSQELITEADDLTKRLEELREELDLQLAEWRDLDAQFEADLKRTRSRTDRRRRPG